MISHLTASFSASCAFASFSAASAAVCAYYIVFINHYYIDLYDIFQQVIKHYYFHGYTHSSVLHYTAKAIKFRPTRPGYLRSLLCHGFLQIGQLFFKGFLYAQALNVHYDVKHKINQNNALVCHRNRPTDNPCTYMTHNTNQR